jgi:hypothetical protein
MYLKTPIDARMIRLLTVHDHDSQGSLHCSLSTTRLDNLPDFIALSYTWGEEEATREIFVNGLRVMIRRNLHDFLDTVANRTLRGELLFIDAICIDQSNIKERESQISHMGAIYSKASRVIAWLGLADGVLSEALANVKESLAALSNGGLGTLLQVSYGEEMLRNTQKLVDKADELVPRAVKEQVNQVGAHSASPDLLVDLLNPGGFSYSYDRPFWRRVWIVQEIILAQHLTIQVGEYSISPEDYLMGALRRDLSSSRDADTSMRGPRREGKWSKPAKGLLLDREYLRRRVHHGPPIQLYEIILRFGYQQASEPLDHVFGFLGLAQTQIRADYHLTRIELYTYVLTEGAQHFNKTKFTRRDAEALQMFHYACLLAFGFPASHTTVAAITNRALSLNSIPVHIRFLVALQTLFHEKFEATRDDTSQKQHHGRRLRWSTLLAQALWALGCSFASYSRLCVSLQYHKIFDCNLTAPQGETGKYAAWMAFVKDNFTRVKLSLPPGQAIPPFQYTNSPDKLETSSSIGAGLLSVAFLIFAGALATRIW